MHDLDSPKHSGHRHDHDGHGHDHGDHEHGHLEHGQQGHNHSHSGHSHHGHHHHGHGHHGHSHAPNNRKGLLIALVITGGIMLLEFIGGLITDSLALLSDSGHMLSDTAALLLSLIAFGLSRRPSTPRLSFGLRRFEIMAALVNGAALFVIAGIIVWEACQRFADPPEVASGAMTIIAVIGLLANLMSAWFLMRQGDVKDNINMKSAYLHVLGDALGSVGAIAAGILMSLFSWYWADPVISIIVALLILKGAWGVLRSTFHILLEGTPESIDSGEVKEALGRIEGVLDVHDLHIWTITSELNSLSCHLLIADDRNHQDILQQAVTMLKERFRLSHSTIQVENSQLNHGELHCSSGDAPRSATVTRPVPEGGPAR
ncbi:cation transporter [Cohnella thailandensis]|uniref:Cation transporter n=2 Tax=Cohnella thailandensis TaxID=557557 RepID=A0A841SPF5_9BACL|nr:cation transporter [Cohnella thailandensis]